MSGLTCTGVGLVVLTAVGLAVKGMQTMQARKLGRRVLNPVARTQPPSALEPDPVTVAGPIGPATEFRPPPWRGRGSDVRFAVLGSTSRHEGVRPVRTAFDGREPGASPAVGRLIRF